MSSIDDRIDEAIAESFPASDPPPWTLGVEGPQAAEDREVHAALERHWAASAAGDFDAAAVLYAEDVVLDYPQSEERVRGRRGVLASRAERWAKGRFELRRIVGSGLVWVTEYQITRRGEPLHAVSIMELANGKVVHETQYLADATAPVARARPTERKG